MAIHYKQRMADESLLVAVPKVFTRNGETFLLLPPALEGFSRLYEDALGAGVRFIIISAYRNFDFQKTLFEDAERRYGAGNGSRWVAPPGHSEHHTGLVVDVGDFDFPETDDEPSFESTPACAWILKNGPRYGFTLSFPKDNIQGVGYEPWHWKFNC